jgi:RNA polymerase sigma-70 factor (ECF subfamily)
MTGLKELAAQFMAQRHSLTAFIEGLVRDPAAAEDIFQEVWIRLAEAAEKGTPIEDLPRWCRGVARNLILHYWRDKRGEREVPETAILDIVETAFVERQQAAEGWLERRTALGRCIDQLPDHARDLLRMKYDQGRSMAQIGRLLNRSLNGVMVSLSRLRNALSDCVEKRLKPMESDA